jgi:hypothetical protein
VYEAGNMRKTSTLQAPNAFFSFSVFISVFILFMLLLLSSYVHAGAVVNLINPPNNGQINYPQFTFNHTLGAPSGVANCSLFIAGIKRGSYTVAANVNYTATPDTTTLPEGQFIEWYVNCTNSTATQLSQTWKFLIDRNPPEIWGADAQDSETQTVTFTVSARDDYSDRLNCSLYIDRLYNQSAILTETAGEEGQGGAIFTAKLDGAHTWNIVCTDMAGNSNSTPPAVVSANDKLPPAIYLDTPENGSLSPRTQQTLIFVVFDNSSLSRCSVFLDGSWTGQTINVSSTPEGTPATVTVSGLAVGGHNWSVRCSDKLGHEGASGVSYFSIDPNLPFDVIDVPRILIVSPDPIKKYAEPGVSIELEYIPYDSKHQTLNCSIYVDNTLADNRIAPNATHVTVEITNESLLRYDHQYQWTVECKDDAGNAGQAYASYVIYSFERKKVEPFLLLSQTHIVWAAIVIAITAALLGMAIMGARIFGVPAWEAWAKQEFGNLFYTVVIVVFFVAFSVVIESISHSLADDVLSSQTGGYWYQYREHDGRWGLDQRVDCPFPCHFYIARGFLGTTYERYGATIKDVAAYLALSRLAESVTIGANTAVTPWFSKFNIAFGTPLNAGLIILNNSISKALSELLNMVGAMKAQEIALAFMPGLSSAFFIAGILFRVPWFTRKLGGLLIALAIGIYTILPLIYVLAWYTVDRSTISLDASSLSPVLREGGSPGDFESGFGLTSSPDILFTKYDAQGREEQIGLLDIVGRAYLINTLIPVLAIFATIGFVRHFSPMIGGDVEIAGLTRII